MSHVTRETATDLVLCLLLAAIMRLESLIGRKDVLEHEPRTVKAPKRAVSSVTPLTSWLINTHVKDHNSIADSRIDYGWNTILFSNTQNASGDLRQDY